VVRLSTVAGAYKRHMKTMLVLDEKNNS